MQRLVLASILFLAAASNAFAQVAVQDPWVRATVPQQKVTGAFMRLTASGDTRLVEVRSPVAQIVEIHEMAMSGNVMKMRAVSGIDLPAGRMVELKPGGYHVMLIDLKRQIREGDVVPITLVFEGKDRKRETVEVKAHARALSAAGGM